LTVPQEEYVGSERCPELLGVKRTQAAALARRESPRLNRGGSSGTVPLEGSRGWWNARCSGEMRRDRAEHPWRRRPTGLTLTLRYEGVGSERD
jgi:hypothetical protein